MKNENNKKAEGKMKKMWNNIIVTYEKHKKLVHIVLLTLLLLAVALFFILPLFNKGVKTPEEFEAANTILHKKVKGDLNDNWYTQLRMADLLPKDVIYVDYDTLFPKTIVVGNEKIAIERNEKNLNLVKAKSEDDAQTLRRIIKEQFKIVDDETEITVIADSIGAIPEYVDTIAKTKGVDRDNCILSLIYNTVVGDSKGHMAVCLNNNKLKIIRLDDFDFCAINVKRFYTIMKNIQEGKASTADRNLLQILVEEGALDTIAQLNIAYYDLRHDCVRGARETICRFQSDKDRFQRIAKQLKAEPITTYIYDVDRDSLKILDDTFLCNDTVMFVKIDVEALKAATIAESNTKVYNVLLLLIGLVMGLVAYPLFKKGTKNDVETISNPIIDEGTEQPKENEDKPVTKETVIEQYKQTEEFKNIKNKAKQYEDMKRSAKDFKEMADKYRDKSDEYEKTVKKYNELQSCKNELDLINALQRQGMTKIHSFQQVKEKNYTLEDVIKMYDSQTKHDLTKEFKEMEKKAQWYDSNISVAVTPIDSFRKTIRSREKLDRAFFFESTINELALPILGEGYKKSLGKFLAEDKEIMQQAKAYQILIGTKEDFVIDTMIASLSKEVGLDNAKWMATLREAARRYASIKSFSDTMWEKFVKEFVNKEPTLKDSSSVEDKGWYFGMLMNIAYHTADHIRSIKDSGNVIYCYNKHLMDKGFDMNVAKNFSYNNINESTNHTNTIYQWASEVGVKKLEIVVDNYAIMK